MAEKLKNVVRKDSSDDDNDKETELDLSLKKLELGPKKKLLVLCLGGLLVQRVHLRYKKCVQAHKPDAICGKFLVFKRPFCAEFLNFCFERFEVGLWSSARECNVDSVLSVIMPGLREKLAFIWDQSECTDSGFEALEDIHKPIFLKELKKLWENKYNMLPWNSGEYSSSNTLMIDDEPYKALLNPPNTAIFPNKFVMGGVKDLLLGPKGDLQVYLDEVAIAKDVPGYVKDHPFGKPAISNSHSDWNFYDKIIQKFDVSEDDMASYIKDLDLENSHE